MEVQNEQEDELLIMPSSKPFSSPSLSPPPPSSLSSSPPSSTPSAVSPQSTPGSVSGGENEKKKKYKSGHHLAGCMFFSPPSPLSSSTTCVKIALLAGLKVLRLYFVKQYITVEGKRLSLLLLLFFNPLHSLPFSWRKTCSQEKTFSVLSEWTENYRETQ